MAALDLAWSGIAHWRSESRNAESGKRAAFVVCPASTHKCEYRKISESFAGTSKNLLFSFSFISSHIRFLNLALFMVTNEQKICVFDLCLSHSEWLHFNSAAKSDKFETSRDHKRLAYTPDNSIFYSWKSGFDRTRQDRFRRREQRRRSLLHIEISGARRYVFLLTIILIWKRERDAFE